MSDASETPAPFPPRDKRIVKHIRALEESGQDIEKFVTALRDIRDDASLTPPQREAIFKTMAQDAAQAYYVMVTGKPIELDKLVEQAQAEDEAKAKAAGNTVSTAPTQPPKAR